VEAFAVEEFGLATLDPFRSSQRLTLWAVAISTGSVANARVATLIALLDLSAKSSSEHTSMAVMTRRCAVDIDAPCFSR
jgi:hypothetical protein